MLKGLINKLLSPTIQQPVKEKTISTNEIEAIVEAKLKEHAATLEKPEAAPNGKDEDYSLTDKQIDFALSLLDKVKNEYILVTDPANLTLKDLNKLIAYNKFKNKGILINLAKKGVIKKI
ncbi:hypothetical protein AM500_12960 [Bacillus sp. FJAT-18017]|uniref:hypothetical protein n=1 Tax=Bacillus sp. FJAT-18017 TaxID=1705566 RepID=UPI0006ADE6C8|nr:hypothetical protein [Bacillus sp. FJAT-18017]ALC90592.1 hypothetical protein AM500_12960 [Bacillus sp. FJAT-18017]